VEALGRGGGEGPEMATKVMRNIAEGKGSCGTGGGLVLVGGGEGFLGGGEGFLGGGPRT
jgi:hypothetical protein